MARQMRMVSVEDVKKISYRMAVGLGWKEKIPAFETRYKGKLEGALSAPFHIFGSKHVYRGVPAKAAALFYFLIKDHPFQNGNKRIALTTTFVYLYRNKYWLKITPDELYSVATWVSDSPPLAKEEAIRFLTKTVRKHIVKLS